MNTMYLAILVIAGALFSLPGNGPTPGESPEIIECHIGLPEYPEIITFETLEKSAWEQKAIAWLADAQSPNGGWGAGSHTYQNIRDPHLVQTDPATTAFAAMALMRAGGPVHENVYKEQILKALDRILKDIDSRPNNRRITPLEDTQPQRKLGNNIDASMALQFLTEISDHVRDRDLVKKIDDAAGICIQLLQNSQNADGGWAGGGWAPVLQSAMANNALEIAQSKYTVDEKVIEKSRKYQSEIVSEDNINSGDAAGIPLYAVASAQRATTAEAAEVDAALPASVKNAYASGKLTNETLIKELEKNGISNDKARRLTSAYAANQSSKRALQNDEIWEGFGNNGGEEYLSYLLTSESLAQQGKEEWLKWKQSIEPKFRQSQNENGSWSGHHCITSPVFCTAAIVQALNVRA